MPVEYAGTTAVASRLLRYTVKPKPGQTIKERVLHIAGQNCRPATAEREFAATRRRHGTQRATRKAPATYALPEPGEVATHVRRTYPGGRRYWAVAKRGEEPTHLRHEGFIVRQAEARHLITSFGFDEVNPVDPEQTAKAFDYVVARHAALYPGEQATFVGQAEGKGGNFHVHVTRNATLYGDMEVDGKHYKAGRKLAGDITDIDKMRERADRFLAEHGHEYGLLPQRLPSMSERKKERRSQRDRRMAAEGTLSNHDRIRKAFEASMADPRAMDLGTWKAIMAEHDVAVTEPGWRRGMPPKVPRLSYQLTGVATPVRAKTLGEHYDHASALEQLHANAQGRPRTRRPEYLQAGVPRPAARPTAQELADAQDAVARIAREERCVRIEEDELYDWVAARGNDEGIAVGDILNRLPESHEARRRVMQLWNRLAKAHEVQLGSPAGYQEEHRLETPDWPSSGVESQPQQPDPAARGPVPGVLDSDLIDLVILDEGLVQYGIYRVDSTAMYRAGIEPSRITDARAFWEALSAEEQGNQYQLKRSLQLPPQTSGGAHTAEGQNPPQTAQRPARGMTAGPPIEERSSQSAGRHGQAAGARQPLDGENKLALAAHLRGTHRGSLRRPVFDSDDESLHSEEDREFGA
ncbi:hypothetical protein [Arthrobacter sp.]|uniref:hypothetical protein n=1 Tax=Arthrobacter sp. TaxID=1667 RepID=UPI003A907F69